MKAIETRYGGTLYRSRTEAKWAVFFDCAGIAFQYEPDGYVLATGPYLPDFWLPGFGMFMEIKGQEPTEQEAAKCADLSLESAHDVLLAIGAPAEKFQIQWYRNGARSPGLFVLAKDYHAEWGFYLVGTDGGFDGGEEWIGPTPALGTSRIPRGPMLTGAIELAYMAAGAARFEHGAQNTSRRQPYPEPDAERRVA